jgi:AcrR family transcriptional regulator
MRADAQVNHNRLLEVAVTVITKQGVDASMRDIARQAGVGLATLLRHFPTREALLEELLRANFDDLAAQAARLETSSATDKALLEWLRECIAWTAKYRGIAELMATAIEDPESALHASCVRLREAGTRLLTRAQAAGTARTDITGADLFALASALAWLSDKPPLVPEAEHLFDLLTDALLTRHWACAAHRGAAAAASDGKDLVR